MTSTTSNSPQWQTGSVDWFDDVRGFGMLTDTESGERFQFHYSTISTQCDGWRSAKSGQVIRFWTAGGRLRQIVQAVVPVAGGVA